MNTTTVCPTATAHRAAGQAAEAACVARRIHPAEVTHSLIAPIRHALAYARSRTCDFTLGGIYMWQRRFAYRCAVVDDTVFMTGLAEGSDTPVPAWAVPVGAMDTRLAVAAVLRYCRALGIAPVFSAVPVEYLDMICGVMGPDATVTEITDWADYLYSARDLATLTGKRYNKKRNHVNRFVHDNPTWQLEDLTPELIPETLLFLSGRRRPEWDTEDPMLSMALYEHNACADTLRNFRHFPFEGAVLRGSDGDIVAFSVAEVIGDTAYVHIEKANHNVAGAGEAINHFFAARLLQNHPSLRYLNREDDSGDLSLRRAKTSYHPISLLAKFNISLPR